MRGLQGQVPSRGAHERQPHVGASLPLSLSLPLRLKIRKENLFKKIPHSSIRENLVTGYVI